MKKQAIDFVMCGRSCSLLICENPTGASSNYREFRDPSFIIKIDNSADKFSFLQMLFHELNEGILLMHQTRFECSLPNNPAKLFMFDHDKLTVMSDELFMTYEILRKKLRIK
jgi:hypothetical protein